MANTQILDMSMKLCLELATIVGPDFPDTKREPVDDMIYEVYGISLCVLFIDFQGTHAHGVIDCRVLKPANLFFFLPWNVKNLTSI